MLWQFIPYFSELFLFNFDTKTSSISSSIRLTYVPLSLFKFYIPSWTILNFYSLERGLFPINYYPHQGLFYSKDMHSEYPSLSLYNMFLADLPIWYLLNVCFAYQFMGSRAARIQLPYSQLNAKHSLKNY